MIGFRSTAPRVVAACLSTVMYLFCLRAAAHAQECGPVFCGSILNVSLECLNDGSAVIVDYNKTDEIGWQYSFDSPKDSTSPEGVGGGSYEIYGIAVRELQDEVWVVINGNTPLEGIPAQEASDGYVGWGDLFINVTNEKFLDSHNERSLYAIRFTQFNESQAPKLGLYSHVAAMSVSATNAGYPTWAEYAADVAYFGSVAVLGDYGVNQSYYDNNISLNVIASGHYLGLVEFLSDKELADEGYNSALFDGKYHIGFRFAKGLIIDECGVFGGDGSSCRDCLGVSCGSAVSDQCGVCNGDGKSCLDCKDVPNGGAVIDQCGVCDGDGKSCLDCVGTPNGSAKPDRCGVCEGDGSSCLECYEVQQHDEYAAVRLALRRQMQIIRKELRQKRLTAEFKKQVLKEARSQYKSALAELDLLPLSVLRCENVQYCVDVDVASVHIEKIADISIVLRSIAISVIRQHSSTFEDGQCEGSVAECIERVKERQRQFSIKRREIIRRRQAVLKAVALIQKYKSNCN